MKKVTRQDIHWIVNHSNISEKDASELLNKHIYRGSSEWKNFSGSFSLVLGIVFIVSGVVFFFAYNWMNMHKFLKIGLIEALIIISSTLLMFSGIAVGVRKIILTAISVFVGVLFAVFGQIYQTGANAYDLFLGWTLAITIWVAVNNFPPLWLIYLTLVNTTVILYWQQVLYNGSDIWLFTILFLINLTALILPYLVC